MKFPKNRRSLSPKLRGFKTLITSLSLELLPGQAKEEIRPNKVYPTEIISLFYQILNILSELIVGSTTYINFRLYKP